MLQGLCGTTGVDWTLRQDDCVYATIREFNFARAFSWRFDFFLPFYLLTWILTTPSFSPLPFLVYFVVLYALVSTIPVYD